MAFNELVSKFKGKPLTELFTLFKSGFPLFQKTLEEHSELKIKSSLDQLAILLEALVSIDQGIDEEEVELLKLIYNEYLPKKGLPTIESISGNQESMEYMENYSNLVGSTFTVIEQFISSEAKKQTEIKEAMEAVFFSVFYANGVLDSKQKELLKKIENLKPIEKDPTIEDLPRLMNEYKTKTKDELVEIFVSNSLVIRKAHDILSIQSNDYESYYTQENIYDGFILPVIGLDGGLEEDEYEFVKAVGKRLSNKSIPTIEEVRKTIENSEYTELMNIMAQIAQKIDFFLKGAHNAYIFALLAAFASNGAFDSRQKELLKTLVSAPQESESSANKSSAGKSSSASSASNKPTTVSGGNLSQPVDVQVLDFGGTTIRDDDTYYMSIGAQINNPNKLHLATRVVIKINILDASGRVIESDNDTIYHIDPNTVFNYGKEIYISSGTPSKIQVFATAEGFSSSPDGKAVYDGIDVGDYSFSEERYSGYTIKGQATSRYVKKIDYVSVYLMFLDSNNKIQGGCDFTISDMFSNVTEAFSENVNLNMNSISYVRYSIDMY